MDTIEQRFTPHMKWHELVLYCYRFRESNWIMWNQMQQMHIESNGTSDCFGVLMELDRQNIIDGYPIWDALLQSKLEKQILKGSIDKSIDISKRIVEIGNKNDYIYVFYNNLVLPIPTKKNYQKHNCTNWIDFNNLTLPEASRIYNRPFPELTTDEIKERVRPELLNQPKLPSIITKTKKQKQYEKLFRGKRAVFLDGDDIKSLNELLNN